MVRTRNNGLLWHGTRAERLLNIPNPTEEGMMFRETDTGRDYVVFDQTWVLQSGGGMVWQGEWSEGEYIISDVVRDGQWTMIANTTTTDRAAPQPYGELGYLLPTTPVWTPLSQVAAVWTGLRVSGLTDTYGISGIRVWLPNVSSSLDYRVLIEDNNTGVLSVSQIFSGDILSVAGWLTVTVEKAWITPSDDITFWLLAENTASTSNYNHPWIYTGSSNQDTDPLTGNINNRNQQNKIRINKTDDDGTDRSAELTQAITGTIIRIANESDLTKYYEYEVVSQTDQGTWVLYDTIFIDTGVGGQPLNVRSQVYFTVPTPAAVDYVELTNNWSGNAQLNGEIIIGSGSQVSNQNAYGVDIKVQKYIVSDDWDLVSHSEVIP